MMVDHQAVARRHHGSREEGPRGQPGIGKKWVRRSVTFHTCQPVKNEGKNQHSDERLKNCPQPAQQGLAIADLNVPPDQEGKELPVKVYFLKINSLPAFTRPDGQLERGGHLAPGAVQNVTCEIKG